MFGGNKKGDGASRFGALRSGSTVLAPRLEFSARGHESKVDLRRFCAPVENQQTLPACNACAVVSALEFQNLKAGRQHVDLSVLYVYWFARKLAGNEKNKVGLLCHHATAAVMAYGVCEDKDWPYKVDRWDSQPPERAQRESTRFDAVQYARLASSDAAKVSLSEGVPVLFGLDIPGAYYDAAASTGLLPGVGTYDHLPMDGHTMLVVGYDDAEKTWLAQNSWGANWGENGYCRIPYDLAAKYTWNDELWAIGALENIERARLLGPSVQQAVSDTQQNAVVQVDEALRKLGKEIGEDLDKRVSDAKLSIRERLQAQERDLEARRKKD
jgi:C1A family cysteine protease